MSGYAAYGPASNPQGTPWGNGPSGPQPACGWGPPGWHACGPSRLLSIALTILGFMLWWPIGLVVLALTFGRNYMGCSSTFREARREWREQRRAWKRGWRGFAGDTGSGNRAFDEYRAETLRRLEEEQQEFASFLDRLRFAKDKAEFDAFMAERRRSAEPPPDAHPA